MRYLAILTLLVLPFQALAQDATDAINALRAQAGRAPLSLNAELQAAAEAHARDMAKYRYFSHTGRNGSTHATRAKRAGYSYRHLSENIAQNQPSMSVALNAWMNSPGHRKNILNSRARDYGLAVAKDANGITYWVMMLGRER